MEVYNNIAVMIACNTNQTVILIWKNIIIREQKPYYIIFVETHIEIL